MDLTNAAQTAGQTQCTCVCHVQNIECSKSNKCFQTKASDGLPRIIQGITGSPTGSLKPNERDLEILIYVLVNFRSLTLHYNVLALTRSPHQASVSAFQCWSSVANSPAALAQEESARRVLLLTIWVHISSVQISKALGILQALHSTMPLRMNA